MFARTRHNPMGGGTIFGSPRGTEAPMDFEYTDRKPVRPVWATGPPEDASTPRKRPFGEMHPPPSPFPGPSSPAPMFSRTAVPNVPFVMNIPPPQTTHAPAWVPPVRDIDMADVSALSADTSMTDGTGDTEGDAKGKEGEGERERGREGEREDSHRTISTGGLRRLYRSRQRVREKSRRAHVRVEDGASGSEDEDSEADELHPPVQNTMNHYTVNLSSPAPQSDMPAVLTGYLQFAFNCSLAAVFFYLLVLAIFTVQRDVQHRLGEYSMDIVQEIGQCALHFKQNLCGVAPVPAMLHQCGLWETCMNRDPSKVGTARVVAELVAEVINSFVEPISWKTLMFTVVSLTSVTLFINSAPALLLRRRAPQPVQIPQPHHSYNGPPLILGTPARGRLGNHSWRPEEDVELPSRRRKLESGGVKEIR